MTEAVISATVELLDAISGGDPEAAHFRADEIIRSVLPPELEAAYQRVRNRCDWWAYS